ncbi:MAG: hypothetical protein FMNOHCHN_00293 [Ignavibacteriaceae bacterium]|nr:hypothetical protein [Ignavibacteriaceae bacterium]
MPRHVVTIICQYKKTPDEAGVLKLKFKNYKLQSINNSYFIIHNYFMSIIFFESVKDLLPADARSVYI